MAYSSRDEIIASFLTVSVGFVTTLAVGSCSTATHAVEFQPPHAQEVPRSRTKVAAKTKSTGKASPHHHHHLHPLTAETRRLKSKRLALEKQNLLTARTGSLYDFIAPPTSSNSVRSMRASCRYCFVQLSRPVVHECAVAIWGDRHCVFDLASPLQTGETLC